MTAPATTPALSHSSWRHLLRALRDIRRHVALRTLPAEFLRTALVAPATLARWIAAEQPHLLDKSELNIVIAGAAKGLDSLDDGRWYQLLPDLLGRPEMIVKVWLVGPELKAGESFKDLRHGPEKCGIIKSAGAREVQHLPAATIAPTALADWWQNKPDGTPLPDICFMFHPALEAFGGSWFSSTQGLTDLARLGVQIGGTSTCIEELWQEDWLARRYGFAMNGAATPNPFSLERDNTKTGGRWSALTWTLDPTKVPAPEFAPLKPDLVRFYLAMDQARPGFAAVGNAIFGFIGGVIPLQNLESKEHARLVGLPAGVLLRLEDGVVMAQTDTAFFAEVTQVPPLLPEHMADFPGESAHPVDRFIWACEKFRGFIEPVFLGTASKSLQSYEDLLPSDCSASFLKELTGEADALRAVRHANAETPGTLLLKTFPPNRTDTPIAP